MSKIYKFEDVRTLPQTGSPDTIYIRGKEEYIWNEQEEVFERLNWEDQRIWNKWTEQNGDYTTFSAIDISGMSNLNPHEVLVKFTIPAGSSRDITLTAHFIPELSTEETAMPSWYYDANYNGVLAVEFTWTTSIKRIRIISGWTQFKQGASWSSNNAEMAVYYR